MIKDRLHTISDEDAEAVARLLIKTTTPYDYTLTKIARTKWDNNDGTDTEESISVYFDAKVKNDFDEAYIKSGWQDCRVVVGLVESDRYHNYPHFYATTYSENNKPTNFFLANIVEAIEFLQNKNKEFVNKILQKLN